MSINTVRVQRFFNIKLTFILKVMAKRTQGGQQHLNIEEKN